MLTGIRYTARLWTRKRLMRTVRAGSCLNPIHSTVDRVWIGCFINERCASVNAADSHSFLSGTMAMNWDMIKAEQSSATFQSVHTTDRAPHPNANSRKTLRLLWTITCTQRNQKPAHPLRKRKTIRTVRGGPRDTRRTVRKYYDFQRVRTFQL